MVCITNIDFFLSFLKTEVQCNTERNVQYVQQYEAHLLILAVYLQIGLAFPVHGHPGKQECYVSLYGSYNLVSWQYAWHWVSPGVQSWRGAVLAHTGADLVPRACLLRFPIRSGSASRPLAVFIRLKTFPSVLSLLRVVFFKS